MTNNQAPNPKQIQNFNNQIQNTQPLKYAYFPGCASKAIEKEYTDSTKLACQKLGIELIDMPEFSCCGAGVLREKNHELNTALNARNFALAEKEKLDIVTICSTCLLTLRKDLMKLNNDKKELDKANKVLAEVNLKYNGGVNVTHLLWVIAENFGWQNLKKKITNPLKGLKIAGFYGCHLIRPKEIVGGHQDEDQPKMLEELIKSVGAIPIEVPEKTECCGFHIVLINEKPALKMSGSFLKVAKEAGADLIITTCPFCHLAMDAYQPDIDKEIGTKLNLPIWHFTQLIGVALGMEPKKLGLGRHVIKSSKLKIQISKLI